MYCLIKIIDPLLNALTMLTCCDDGCRNRVFTVRFSTVSRLRRERRTVVRVVGNFLGWSRFFDCDARRRNSGATLFLFLQLPPRDDLRVIVRVGSTTLAVEIVDKQKFIFFLFDSCNDATTVVDIHFGCRRRSHQTLAKRCCTCCRRCHWKKGKLLYWQNVLFTIRILVHIFFVYRDW